MKEGIEQQDKDLKEIKYGRFDSQSIYIYI